MQVKVDSLQDSTDSLQDSKQAEVDLLQDSNENAAMSLSLDQPGATPQQRSKGILDRILSDRIRQEIRREDSFVTSTDVEKQGLGCCPICNEELCQHENTHESVLRLVCSHVFHQDCLLPWLGTHNTCPICRASITMHLCAL
jgi:hypothetical protein